MKWQNHAALIAGIVFVGAGQAQAQVHHGVYAPMSPVMNHNAWHGQGNGNVGYNHMWGAAATNPANYYHPNAFVPTTAGLGAASPNAFRYPLNNSSHYGHQGILRTATNPVVSTTTPVVTTTTPVITGSGVTSNLGTSNLATMRQEVRADKMAVKNDLATGNNGRLRQDEMRLQSDEQMERQLRQQGYGMVNSGRSNILNNNVNNNFNRGQIDRMLPTSQVTRRDNLRQNFDALHANYKNRANDAASIHARNKEAAARGAGHTAAATRN